MGKKTMSVAGAFLLVVVVIMASLLTAVVSAEHCSAKTPPKVRKLRNAIEWLVNNDKRKISRRRSTKLARLFVKYGELWKVDPWLAAVVSFHESGFRDRPRRVKVWRCRKIDGGQVCVNKWPGDRGILQIIPRYAQDSFTACKELVPGDTENLYNTESSVCVGIHLMAKRRAAIELRKKRRGFIVRGARYRWTRLYGPCGYRQRKFCRNGFDALCKRFWWIASWNWGSHRLYCGGRWQYDFTGYPIRVLSKYKTVTKRFRR